MFGRASSRPIQKLEADPCIAILPCEALSKGPPPPKLGKITYPVGRRKCTVGRKNAIAFSCSEPRNFQLAAGSRGALWSPVRRQDRPELAIQPGCLA